MGVVLAIADPYAGFVLGVLIADLTSLYPNLTRGQLWLRASPVGTVVVSIMLQAATVSIPCEGELHEHYSHAGSVPEFLLFVGSMAFIGTLAPDMFGVYRARLSSGTDELTS